MIPILFCLVLINNPSYSQNRKMAKAEKSAFSTSIRKITVWTYATGDSAFRYYDNAWNEILELLSAKGYHTEQVFYKSYLGISPAEWKENTIKKLAPGEAFLDLSTVVYMDTTGRRFSGGRVIAFVTDRSGKILAEMNQPVTGTTLASYVTLAHAMLYAHFPKEQPGRQKIYEYSDSVQVNALDKAVDLVLAGIPNSTKGPVYSGHERFGSYAELGLWGGYVSGGSMNVTGGDVDYLPNGQFGADLSIGITRSVDVVLQYTLIKTRMNIHSSLYPGKDPFSFNLNYCFLGVDKNFRLNRVFNPFIGLYVGGVNTVPSDNLYRDTWYFAMQARAGVKFYIVPFFGVILQGNAYFQMHPVGAPFIYSDDYNKYPVDSDSNLFQYGISGGIFFRIGR